MNKEIQALAEQAELNLELQSLRVEKFAELIVKKCAMIGNYAYDGGEYPGKMIKEYFGVEE